jgi:hypothetical protein
MTAADPPRNEVIAPDAAELRKIALVHEHASRDKELEIGRIGEFFGSRDNAAVYLAASIILFALIGGTIVAYNDPTLRPDAMKALFGLAATALGFMIGRQKA